MENLVWPKWGRVDWENHSGRMKLGPLEGLNAKGRPETKRAILLTLPPGTAHAAPDWLPLRGRHMGARQATKLQRCRGKMALGPASHPLLGCKCPPVSQGAILLAEEAPWNLQWMTWAMVCKERACFASKGPWHLHSRKALYLGPWRAAASQKKEYWSRLTNGLTPYHMILML